MVDRRAYFHRSLELCVAQLRVFYYDERILTCQYKPRQRRHGHPNRQIESTTTQRTVEQQINVISEVSPAIAFDPDFVKNVICTKNSNEPLEQSDEPSEQSDQSSESSGESREDFDEPREDFDKPQEVSSTETSWLWSWWKSKPLTVVA